MPTAPSVHLLPGLHCGGTFQLHDVCPESHPAGCEGAVGGRRGGHKISGEKYQEELKMAAVYDITSYWSKCT